MSESKPFDPEDLKKALYSTVEFISPDEQVLADIELDDLKVLVVDDSAYNRRTIIRMLEEIPGVKVVDYACDGEEALRKAVDLKPDLITLDLEMPRMDGFTVLRIIMQNRPVPVIVVSSRSDDENVFRAMEFGAVTFIPKPSARISPELFDIRDDLHEKVKAIVQAAGKAISAETGDKSVEEFAKKFSGEELNVLVEDLHPDVAGLAVGLHAPGANPYRAHFVGSRPTEEVFKSFASIGRWKLSLDKATVSIELVDTPIADALDAVCAQIDCVWSLDELGDEAVLRIDWIE